MGSVSDKVARVLEIVLLPYFFFCGVVYGLYVAVKAVWGFVDPVLEDFVQRHGLKMRDTGKGEKR